MRKEHAIIPFVALFVMAAASIAQYGIGWLAAPGLAQGRSPSDLRALLSVPADYRTAFHFLGTFAVAGESGRGAKELHSVYASPDVIPAYRVTGRFPHGAVLVKEVFETDTADMTTGQVSHAGRLQGWIVMVKDTGETYRDDPLWGEGWGWAWFNADSPTKTSTSDFRGECLGCHEPARSKDWVYVQGYPALR